jgi:hypothetical protein
MSKYIISHSCGHEVTHQLFGPGKDRESKAQWLETTLCTECWKVQQAKERAEKIAVENQRSAELAKNSGLPTLTGSEKQITWGMSIRQQMIDSLETFIKECGDRPEWTAKFAALREAFGVVVLGNTTASWFIDNRGFGTVRVAFGKALIDWCKANRPEVMEVK